MTHPNVNKSDPRNWVAPGASGNPIEMDGQLGGPEYYEGRGPLPVIGPLTPPKSTTLEELVVLKKKHTCLGCQSAMSKMLAEKPVMAKAA
jgi:hypothetical protein